MDAKRVIERLNGFTIYGFRLTVKMARYEGKRRWEQAKEWFGEIFSNVELCFENLITRLSRATWLESMCSFTLLESSYADKIGRTLFEALGENANEVDTNKVKQEVDSILVTSSYYSMKPSPTSDGTQQEVEEDITNAILLRKEFNDCCVMENFLGRKLSEEDSMGKGLNMPSLSEERS
ncbi:hypothetical protein V6N13_024557 [Hibiscus sabdariffa]